MEKPIEPVQGKTDWYRTAVFIAYFEHVSWSILLILLMTFNRFSE